MQKKTLLIIALLGLSLSVSAQKKGYNIRLSADELKGKYYFIGFYGEESFKMDSTTAHHNTLIFKGRKMLANGFYQIVQVDGNQVFPLVIEQSRKLIVDHRSAEITSEENRIYYNYVISSVEPRTYVRAVTSAHPNTLASQYMLLETFGNDTLLPDEPALLHHPYFDKITWPLLEHANADTLDSFFYRHNVHREIGRYYLGRKILQLWSSDADNDLLVYLYDRYYSPELHLFDEEHDRLIRKYVERARRVAIGATIPAMTACNIQGKTESTREIHRTYTVIWFWDPDCEDCMIETPQLHRFYTENADKYDFEVFAVSITEDIERWEKISKQMGLSWINTCYATGKPNYDFIDYFNILTTPASFLIDANHKIIMRAFSLEQLQDFFQTTYKNSEE